MLFLQPTQGQQKSGKRALGDNERSVERLREFCSAELSGEFRNLL